MQFDLTKLPDKAQLSLCEMVTFLAWGVALKPDELGHSGSPSERASQGEWDAQVAECQSLAEADPDLTDLVRLLSDWRGIPLMPTADALEEICRTKVVETMIADSKLDDDDVRPLPEQLKTYRLTWPPACQALYHRAIARQAHRKAEWGELKEQWRAAESPGSHAGDQGDAATMTDTYRSAAEASADKTELQRLLSALDAAKASLRLDECRGWRVKGARGHICSWGPGGGWLLYVACRSPRHWTSTKQRLSFCEVVQDGDDEGVLRLQRLPSKIEAAAIRKALAIRQARLAPANAFATSTANEGFRAPTALRQHPSPATESRK